MNTFVENRVVSSLAMAGAMGMLAFGGWLRGVVAPQMSAPAALSRGDQERLEHSVSASLFGELRGGLADYLWMKADRLLHNGVEMRALTVSEKQDGRRFHASVAASEGSAAPGSTKRARPRSSRTVRPTGAGSWATWSVRSSRIWTSATTTTGTSARRPPSSA